MRIIRSIPMTTEEKSQEENNGADNSNDASNTDKLDSAALTELILSKGIAKEDLQRYNDSVSHKAVASHTENIKAKLQKEAEEKQAALDAEKTRLEVEKHKKAGEHDKALALLEEQTKALNAKSIALDVERALVKAGLDGLPEDVKALLTDVDKVKAYAEYHATIQKAAPQPTSGGTVPPNAQKHKKELSEKEEMKKESDRFLGNIFPWMKKEKTA
jgi:hypothetical protein